MSRAALRAAALVAVAAAGLFGATGCTVLNSLIASEKRDIYHFEPEFGIEDPVFRRSLVDTLGQPMVGGNLLQLLQNGDEIFPAMTEAIRGAKASVNLESYIYQNDRAGRLFADALEDAARRGVAVRLLVDAVGSSLGPLEGEMTKAGVRVRTYHPIRLLTIYKIGKRTHRKVLVVDGKICFTGGLGIDDRWLGNAGNENEWRDAQVRAEGPVAAQMQAIFSEDWTFTTGEILAGERFYPRIEPAGAALAQAVKASRGDGSSIAKMLYYVAIKSARKRIWIQNAYFLPDRQFREELVAAVKRGVDVEVMVPGRQIDMPYVRFAARIHYGEVLHGGVRIFEYEQTMLHNKTMVADGMYSTIGSINFDGRSMSRNQEDSLAFYDRDFAVEVEAMFREDLKKCRQITYADWSHRRLIDRVQEVIFWIWEPYY
jgi:cardiolipin synthase A/B